MLSLERREKAQRQMDVLEEGRGLRGRKSNKRCHGDTEKTSVTVHPAQLGLVPKGTAVNLAISWSASQLYPCLGDQLGRLSLETFRVEKKQLPSPRATSRALSQSAPRIRILPILGKRTSTHAL